jgi:hypothetical protein
MEEEVVVLHDVVPPADVAPPRVVLGLLRLHLVPILALDLRLGILDVFGLRAWCVLNILQLDLENLDLCSKIFTL